MTQLLLLHHLLQPPTTLVTPPLDSLWVVDTFLVLRKTELDSVLPLPSAQCHVMGNNQSFWLLAADCTSAQAASQRCSGFGKLQHFGAQVLRNLS